MATKKTGKKIVRKVKKAMKDMKDGLMGGGKSKRKAKGRKATKKRATKSRAGSRKRAR